MRIFFFLFVKKLVLFHVLPKYVKKPTLYKNERNTLPFLQPHYTGKRLKNTYGHLLSIRNQSQTIRVAFFSSPHRSFS
jgi:hypothetical protein